MMAQPPSNRPTLPAGHEEGCDQEAAEGAAAAALEAALRRLRHRHQQEVRHGHHGHHPRQHGESEGIF